MTDFSRVNTPRRTFDLGRVFNNTFGSVGGNFPTFFGLALLLAGVPQLAVVVLQLVLSSGNGDFTLQSGVAGVAIWVISLGASFVLQAAIAHGAMIGLTGRKASFADCLSTGMSHALPVFAISLLAGFGVLLGLVLLVIPGVFLAIIWVVVTPVRVVEGRGILEAFGRSAALTEGSRWMILLTFIVYIVLYLVFTLFAGIIAGLAAIVAGGLSPDAPVGALIVSGIITPVIAAVTALIGAAGVASIYYELRSNKEGVVPSELAAVFD